MGPWLASVLEEWVGGVFLREALLGGVGEVEVVEGEGYDGEGVGWGAEDGVEG